MAALIRLLEEADVAPTAQLAAAVADRHAALAKAMAQWTALNAEIKRAK